MIFYVKDSKYANLAQICNDECSTTECCNSNYQRQLDACHKWFSNIYQIQIVARLESRQSTGEPGSSLEELDEPVRVAFDTEDRFG